MTDAPLLSPFVIDQPEAHNMGNLVRYLAIKLHHLVFEGEYDRIIVEGRFDRRSCINRFEKRDKIANWQRPTARIDDGTLYIECFPGTEYVRHYAAVLASYLAITAYRSVPVFYCLPSEEACWLALDHVGLDDVAIRPTVVIGKELDIIAGSDDWQHNEYLQWKVQTINGRAVTFLAVKFSFWGDIFGRLCAKLGLRGVNNIVYHGKAGGIRADLLPNDSIVTGTLSYVEGEIIRWPQFLSGLDSDKRVSQVVHCNSPSMVFETHEWVQLMGHYDIVESETGHAARTCLRNSLGFTYLHYISNSLVIPSNEDLSNERQPEIVMKRQQLARRIRDILHAHL